MPKNKKTTIDDLARIVKQGFDGVDRKFREVDKRFDEVDKRFDGIERRLTSLEKRVACIEDILTKHSKELENIKISLKELKGQKKAEIERIIALEKRVARLEAKVL